MTNATNTIETNVSAIELTDDSLDAVSGGFMVEISGVNAGYMTTRPAGQPGSQKGIIAILIG